jgi:predicted nucleotidyltransferase
VSPFGPTVNHGRTLDSATLSDAERRTLRRLSDLLRERLGSEVHSLWLYGSRARGEDPRPESDIDLLVVTDGGLKDLNRVGDLAWDAAEEEGISPVYLSLQLYTPEQLEQRRTIRSLFIQEVDRDKIVLLGSP